MQVLVREGEDGESHGHCYPRNLTREKRLETFEPPQTMLEERGMSHQGESRRVSVPSDHGGRLPWQNEFSLTTEFRTSKCYSVVRHQKLELWSLILGRLCITVFPTSGGTGGTEELLI
jgi:hypothetical protein